ncbi:MAG: hypothetical protein ABIG32_04180 [Candidatus Uhrbacteria bacterium]|nr:hypothetical protein [Patescibacteria group bacterium]MBU1907269.1 hypothetical protein [Patescibacteria group bacterium]
MQKVINILAGIALVAAMVPVNYAGATTTDSLSADRVWHYDGYRVERLDFGSREVDGLYSIGEHVIIATMDQGCLGACDRRDLYIVKDGGAVLVPNVPAYILDENRYYMNDERFIWIDKVDLDSNRYDIVELDPATGEKSVILDDVFVNGAKAIDVFASGDEYYFEVVFNFNNHTGFEQAAVYKYDAARGQVMIVTKHDQLNREEVLDVQGDKLLTLMTFENGYKQMWIYGESEWSYAIPNTWTVPHEDIVGAHFTDNGSVEFFRLFERHVWTPNSEAGTTEATGEYLNWYLDPEVAVQVYDDSMVWVDPNRVVHHVATVDSDWAEAGDYILGTLGSTNLIRLAKTYLMFDDNGVGAYNSLNSNDNLELAYIPTDQRDCTTVGVDAEGNVYVQSGSARAELIKLGYGNAPTVSDASHVYWLGTDGNIYEATITAGLSGAKMKLTGDPKVYVMGQDGKLHWIISQAVAYAIYGNTWNQNITEINNLNLVNYSFGTSITSEADIDII